MMNPEIKAKWLAALRSGEYKQTIECLHDGQGFCCLGVLTDLYIKEKGTEWKREITAESDTPVRYFFEEEEESLPDSVKYWAGLDYCDPIVKYEGNELICISRLNDTRRLDFNEIAVVIEEQL